MELAYASTFHHQDVVFYITADGNRVHFVCGGCVYSICRPRNNQAGEIAKFGLVVRGTGAKDRTIANYVRSELQRRELKGISPIGEDEVFLDSVYLLNPNVASEAECINTGDVEVLDECLSEYFTSVRTSPGVSVTGVRVRPQDKVIEVLELPDIVNLSSQFVYTPSPHAFALAQAHLPHLPAALKRLTDGLFDGIPAPRAPLSGAPRRTDIVITGQKSVKPVAGARSSVGAERRATVSEFVQVKHIDRVGRPGSAAKTQTTIPPPTLAELWLVFYSGERAVCDSHTGAFLTREEELFRRAIKKQAWLLFGSATAPRAFIGASLAVSPIHKLAAYYFLIQREKRSPLFPLLVQLTSKYNQHHGINVPPSDEFLLADLLNALFRDALTLGLAAEQLLMFDVLPPRDAPVGSDVRGDSAAVLQLAAALDAQTTDAPSPAIKPEHVTYLGVFMGIVYAGRSRLSAATYTARLTGITSLVLLAAEVDQLSAFDRGRSGADTRARAASYLAVLLSSQLAHTHRGQSV
ncbi:tegument protein [pteropodid alphaherpesvirus 2]|uniref:Tegument protein n=1 Tax=pteropodid alphaherpesvirus 2 TaxID=3118716 RepID=A0A510J9S5_9ALPH|nr:tegument protein [pteropodid alphaherpesvirus 2]BBM13193.1 tegument protein [pteropodid alphaherpesvirus 2]